MVNETTGYERPDVALEDDGPEVPHETTPVAVSTTQAPPTVFNLAALRASTQAQVFRRLEGEETAIATPWASVNEALGGGFWPGFYTLTSGTGAGKTQWALSVALEAASRGVPVHYVALELSGEEVYTRLLALTLRVARSTRVPWSDIYRGKDPLALAYFTDPGDLLDALPLAIEVAPPNGWRAERLIEIAAPAQQPAPRFIIVDFLQLLAAERGEDPTTTMSRVAYAARAVARDHHCTVLALSSTARDKYGVVSGNDKEGGKPGEGDPGRLVGLGKYAGDLEFAADGVLVLVADGEFVPRLGRRIHLAVAKNRGGPAAWCPPVRFDGCTFEPETAQPLASPPSVKPTSGRAHRSPAVEHPLTNGIKHDAIFDED